MRELYSDKKAMTINEIAPLILTLVVIGILIGSGLYINSNLQKKLLSCDQYSTDESISLLNGTTINLTNIACSTLPTTVTNASTSLQIAGNITVTYGDTYTSMRLDTGNVTHNLNGTWAITYLARGYPESYTSVGNVTKATSDLATWLPIIVVILAVSILIGIIIKSFIVKQQVE